MKLVILTTHANLKQDMSDILQTADFISDFTLMDIEGHGDQSHNDPFLSSRDKVVGFVPRVRFELILDDRKVTVLLDLLRASKIGTHEQTYYRVSEMLEHGRLNLRAVVSHESENNIMPGTLSLHGH